MRVEHREVTRPQRARRVAGAAIGGCLLLSLALLGCRRQAGETPALGLPQTEGTLAVDGLGAPVLVRRDRWGVPHITAQTQHDLFLAQGVVQAQDRLFQMDLWRRASQGRLAEVLGPSFIQRDVMTRRIQFRSDASGFAAEWASYGPDARAIAAAFAEGINVVVRRARREVPEEFRLAGWLPQLWRAEDLLNRTDSFTANPSALDEVLRARVIAALGEARVHQLFPLSSGAQERGASEVERQHLTGVLADGLRRIGPPAVFSGLAARVSGPRSNLADGASREDARAAMPAEPIGSGLALAGAKGNGRAPLVAVSETADLVVPAARYLIHLNAPGWHVAGATAPWRPGVAIGHNDRFAWGYAGAAVDGQDLFVERTNPTAAQQIRRPYGWVDAELQRDAIVVRGRDEAVEYDSLHSDAGVIFALDSDRGLAYALKWIGTEPGTAPELGALRLGRATTRKAFDAAVGQWGAPAVDVVYADTDGQVARRAAGLAPVRIGATGAQLSAAWRGVGWRGGQRRGPGADHASLSGGLVLSMPGGEVARRVIDLLEQRPFFDVQALQSALRDLRSTTADVLVPLLAQVRSDLPAVEDARRQIVGWDRQVAADSAPSSLYVAWEEALRRILVGRSVPRDLRDEVLTQFGVPLATILARPDPAWVDGREARDRVLLDALALAIEGGVPPPRAFTLRHPLSVTSFARARFNVGPLLAAGYGHSVQPLSSTRSGTAEGPAFRAVFDAGDWDRSTVSLTPGQSEQVTSPHYADLVTSWMTGEGVPLLFSESAVMANTSSVLTLVPR